MKKGYCITSDESADNFVGIRIYEGVPKVVFPHGFNISDDEKERRKDVFRLLVVLQKFTDRKEGDPADDSKDTIVNFPITSYQYIIQDFLAHGYYTENEVRYVQALKGKINWKRTIQKEQPQLDDNNVVYLSFQVKNNQINSDNLITKIHQYCVYQSFLKFGWLYFSSAYLPPEPPLKLDVKLFVSTLKQALSNTFNDVKKKLFQSMINIILNCESNNDAGNIAVGVNLFDPVWENLVDYTFGDSDKKDYHPKARWTIVDPDYPPIGDLAPLRIDTIMRSEKKGKCLFILDAKYYQYGIKRGNLPGSSDIQKQITYGVNATKVERLAGRKDVTVYNAFIMPFQAENDKEPYRFVSVGTADWEDYDRSETPSYKYVVGILVDTRSIISNYTKHNEHEIERLSDLIETSITGFRKVER